MDPIFAQNNANGAPDEFLVAVLAAVCGIYLVMFIILLFFLATLQRALSRCDSRNRTMEPGMVWLNLIPLFNIVWMFITVNRIGESLQYEFDDRGRGRRGDDYGKGLGIATCALSLASNIPYLGCVMAIGWVVCFIMYWVKIAGYSNQLLSHGDDYDGYDGPDDDDRDDDRRWDR